jgi:hypothetical protein
MSGFEMEIDKLGPSMRQTSYICFICVNKNSPKFNLSTPAANRIGENTFYAAKCNALNLGKLYDHALRLTSDIVESCKIEENKRRGRFEKA